MADILATLGKTIELAKRASDLASELKNVELKEAIADLRLQLADLKSTLADLTNENTDLKRQLADAKSHVGDEMSFRDGVYWAEGGVGPYCTNCYDSSRKKIRVRESPHDFEVFGKYECPSCKAFLGKKGD